MSTAVKEEAVQNKHEDLCRELNMDKDTEEMSWKFYSEASQRFSLEGDPAQWFCCSLYAASRRSITPTVSAGSNEVVRGNCVSLNKMLRCCNMSTIEFFTKIKHWNSMVNASAQFCSQIERLERSFSTTFHLYNNYRNIMKHLYLFPTSEKKNMKFRSAQKCSAYKLNDFCWCLYLCTKNEQPNITVDLVTSFHLLICCIEFIYKNVLAENRVDLINPDFEGVPANWNTPEFDTSSIASLCIIDSLCRLVKSSELPEVKTMREQTWRNIIKEFFRTKTIFGNEETFLDIVSNQNFEQNLKSLNSSYEQYVLSVGEFDERILLNNPCYRKINNIGDESSNMSRMSDGSHHGQEQMRLLIPNTPYTRMHSLPSRDGILEPIAHATNNVNKLLEAKSYYRLPDIIKRAGEDVVKRIDENLDRKLDVFSARYPNQEEAKRRFNITKCVIHYMLEKIICYELRTKPNIDLKHLLNTDHFSTALTVCCMEIVLAAYNSEQKFPWVLECFDMEAFHFWKIIEIIVSRHDGLLTRELIKHLNSVEEKCLEQLSWQSSSSVWSLIGSEPLPGWSDVDATNISRRKEPQEDSPMYSACDSYTQIVPSDSARRDLFNTSKTKSNNLLLQQQQQQVKAKAAASTNAEIKTIINTQMKVLNDINAKKKQLRLFLRKVYKLSWLRMKELCNDLNIDNDESLDEIWTLFEYSLTNMTDLIKDRHLDQLLMCAIYIYMKVGEKEILFLDIMKSYRKQPQATGSTYREVLIKDGECNDLIFFYNEIYVNRMKEFALNFGTVKKTQKNLQLSPHPTQHRTAPIKISNFHDVYITAMEKNNAPYSPNDMIYEVGKSPSKYLEQINECVRRGKRNLPFHDDPNIVKFRHIELNNMKKLRCIKRDRQNK